MSARRRVPGRRAFPWLLGLLCGWGAGCVGGGTAATPPSSVTKPPPVPSRRLVFRQVFAGMMPGESRRITWELRLDAQGMQLSRRREKGPSVVLEKVPQVTWEAVDDVWFRGPPLVEMEELKLAETSGGAGLEMHCHETHALVLAAGAFLVHGDACGAHENGKPPYWKPGERHDVGVLHCEVSEADGDKQPLDFGEEPGIEWAHEDSDCSGQEGALRVLR